MRFVPGLLLGLCLAVTATPALAAGFDGAWIAEISPQAAPCNTTAVMNIIVMGDTLMGEIHSRNGKSSFTGKIERDGGGTFSFGHDTGVINFTADRFDANWVTPKCGQLRAMGDREPSEAQKAAMAVQRKQRQDEFAALVGRAEAGRAVDYTALRSAYPYTESWDFYGNKTNGLMQQAEAAQKGGDCATAMEKLDEIVKLDFTIDSAHALRADCSAAEQIITENAIAYGLIHSLMGSGDGASEKTAYVINTVREEMDVLANRHIQLRTRQVGVRGSDGHYYDVVQGVALKGGAQTKTLYFDVSAFTAGRLSRDAEIAVVAATIH